MTFSCLYDNACWHGAKTDLSHNKDICKHTHADYTFGLLCGRQSHSSTYSPRPVVLHWFCLGTQIEPGCLSRDPKFASRKRIAEMQSGKQFFMLYWYYMTREQHPHLSLSIIQFFPYSWRRTLINHKDHKITQNSAANTIALFWKYCDWREIVQRFNYLKNLSYISTHILPSLCQFFTQTTVTRSKLLFEPPVQSLS
jgi:hypothetical protein